MLHDLRIAIRDKLTIKLVYKDPQGEIRYRRVDPYKMTDKKLYGYCHLLKQETIFNLENVLSLQVTDVKYDQ
ncbi:WYL domain-containing protein [Fuchsiella alkaliacetigena]|uniref:WYL domain-containing protein n=1 Tax=Fuchsiella alkaliacetigena TaxID=957042 RepID=UPI00200A19DE|nr:WYL domain-containing protein [Fuchsiella alkaliacetigena]MCK8824949.1 WYL domain-containing protein [Fuchsiella alkaliacetigena]